MRPKPDQRIEISHDTLAREVYARIGADEKMRIKVAQFVANRYAYFRESGELMGDKELNYIASFLDQIELSAEQREFIRKSRRAVNSRKRRRRLIIALAFAVLTIFLLTAIALWQSAERNKKLARDAAGQLETTNQDLEEQRTAALLARDSAVRSGLLADSLAESARRQRTVAIEQRSKAEQAERDTRQALDALKRSNRLGARLLLAQAKSDVLHLNYDEAAGKLQAAATLGALSDSIATAQLEVAFWYTESGRPNEALQLIKAAATLFGTDIGPGFPEDLPKKDRIAQRNYLRGVLENMASDSYREFRLRYFPVMIPVPKGSFQMGCSEQLDRDCRDEEQPPHQVELPDFKIAATETTFWQFGLFCAATGRAVMDYEPSWGISGDHPAVNVSWFDAVAFANWLSQQLDLTPAYQLDKIPADPRELAAITDWRTIANWQANGVRLPTEAEWEFAARGGHKQAPFIYAGSNTLDQVGWHDDDAGQERTQAVGQKAPNTQSLYDLSGNVDEWCWDWYDRFYYQHSPAEMPTGPDSGSSNLRVLRGGSWTSYALSCRVSSRNIASPDSRSDHIGFRLAQSR